VDKNNIEEIEKLKKEAEELELRAKA